MNTDQYKALVAAVTPDHHSKSAYTGRIEQTEVVEVMTEDGTPIQKEVSFFITWDTIEKFLNLVQKRAGIKQ